MLRSQDLLETDWTTQSNVIIYWPPFIFSKAFGILNNRGIQATLLCLHIYHIK